MKDTLLTEKTLKPWNPIPKVIFIRCCITFAISSILASRRNDLPKRGGTRSADCIMGFLRLQQY